MSVFTSFTTTKLFMRDANGRYATATPEAVLEMARVIIDQKMQRGESFTSPEAVKDYLRVKLAGFEHEVFAILMLDNQHRLIAYSELFRGTVGNTSVHPREVIKEVLAKNAAAVILAHNHPSGHPEPSSADREITDRLQAALEMIDVRILDHIVVGGLKTVSFVEKGLL
ncbi:MAG: DNA repair protein RadC [Moraxellaceae bacterium]|nr:DNA repair protein RadC [Moraxellaceae bacterium]